MKTTRREVIKGIGALATLATAPSERLLAQCVHPGTTRTINYTADTTTKFPNPANGWMIAWDPPYAGNIPLGTPHTPAPALTQTILNKMKSGIITNPNTFAETQTEIGNCTMIDLRFLLC